MRQIRGCCKHEAQFWPLRSARIRYARTPAMPPHCTTCQQPSSTALFTVGEILYVVLVDGCFILGKPSARLLVSTSIVTSSFLSSPAFQQVNDTSYPTHHRQLTHTDDCSPVRLQGLHRSSISAQPPLTGMPYVVSCMRKTRFPGV